MSDSGKIYLHRKILGWEWYSDFNTCRLFIHMLLKANWKDGRFRGTTVPRGSFVSSISKLAEETGLTNDEVRTAISHLIETNEITKQSTNKYTVFTVVNYALYQDTAKQERKQDTSNVQSIPQPFPTIEESNKGNKEIKEDAKASKKKMRMTYFPDDEALDKAFADYVEMRKKIKKPMTDRAVMLAIKKLNELAAIPFSDSINNKLAIQILNQSVMNSWQGLFPLKEQKANYANKKGGDTNGTDNQSWTDAADFYKQFLGSGNSD